MKHPYTINGKTSAINDALACLRNIGCETSHYYIALEKECQFYTCDTVYVNLADKETGRIGTSYTVDTTGTASTSGDGLVNGCLVQGNKVIHLCVLL